MVASDRAYAGGPTEGLAGLRVGVDVRADGLRRTGVGRYGAVLRETLRDFGATPVVVTDGEESFPRVRRWLRAAAGGPRRLGRLGSVWLRPDLFREAHVHFTLHGRLMTLACEDPPDVMHWTCPLPLRLEGAVNVYAVHDLIPLEAPGLSGVPRRRHKRLLEAITESAQGLVTVSETSRSAILRHLGAGGLPVVNTYQSVGRLLPSDKPPPGLDRGTYLLFCGAVEPRKNLLRLVAAHQRGGARFPLVIAGPSGWRSDQALPTPLPHGVIRVGSLARPDLLALISGARALVSPSLAEGFGLPMVEAFALGTPVLASNRGALAEIAGTSALLVDPTDEADLAAGLTRISVDGRLRDALRRKGATRAADFSAAAYAGRLIAAYSAAGVTWPNAGAR